MRLDRLLARETPRFSAGPPRSVALAAEAGAERLAAGLSRVELVFADPAPKNAAEMRKALDPDLLAALHLWLINRGVLIAPFHNMMLVSPDTTGAAIDRLVGAVDGFGAALKDLAA